VQGRNVDAEGILIRLQEGGNQCLLGGGKGILENCLRTLRIRFVSRRKRARRWGGRDVGEGEGGRRSFLIGGKGKGACRGDAVIIY